MYEVFIKYNSQPSVVFVNALFCPLVWPFCKMLSY